jgi:formylglycine-generating enzyme
MKRIPKILKDPLLIFCLAIVFAMLLFFSFDKILVYTSSDSYCNSCHVHPHAEVNWMLSAHNNNRTGISIHCSECHLPPKDNGLARYTFAKAKHGVKDIYGYLTKSAGEIDWKAKRSPEKAQKFVYESSCLKCHNNLYPATLSDKGSEAHLNFEMNPNGRTCITCHVDAGHYDPAAHSHNLEFGFADNSNKAVFSEAMQVVDFKDFTENIPGTSVSFGMKAIKGGKFKMGSNPGDIYAKADEFPQREVELKSFFIEETELTWDEYLAFFNATGSQGRKEGAVVNNDVDAISGATPPWGAPDQGWGKGSRPAITMTYYAATVYCKWLSKVTGKTYRLPTEAEWEYAARSGTSTPYFFAGNPKKFGREGIFRKIFGPDTSVINSYVVYQENSPERTQEPSFVKPNPFGLKNMLGNVAEFCSDFYDPLAYKKYPAGIIKNPMGPRAGAEYVVRGGSFFSSAADLRVAARDFTKTNDWLATDPQIPKSIWWYSDCKHVGFRVVCEFDQNTGNKIKP